MGYVITAEGDTITTYLKEIMADTRADIEKLPTSYLAGSSCLVIEDTSVWVLGTDQVWHELV